MDVVEIEQCGELGVCRSGKEVQAAVLSENAVGKLDNRLYGSIDERVVVALSAGKLHEVIMCVFNIVCVDIYQLHAVLFSLFDGVD